MMKNIALRGQALDGGRLGGSSKDASLQLVVASALKKAASLGLQCRRADIMPIVPYRQASREGTPIEH